MAKRPNNGFPTPEAYRAYHKAWREKNKARFVAWRKKHRGHRGAAHRTDRYSLSEQEYREMLDAQDGCCAICRKEHGTGRMTCLRVDHDHDTGAIRGLLCHSCNVGIGMFGDDMDLLQKAVKYLYLAAHAQQRESA